MSFGLQSQQIVGPKQYEIAPVEKAGRVVRCAAIGQSFLLCGAFIFSKKQDQHCWLSPPVDQNQWQLEVEEGDFLRPSTAVISLNPEMGLIEQVLFKINKPGYKMIPVGIINF